MNANFLVAKSGSIFPFWEIDPEQCTLQDFFPFIGAGPHAVSGELANQIQLAHPLGQCALFFNPDDTINGAAIVQMIGLELDQPIRLVDFARHFQAQPKLMVTELADGDQELIHTAKFTPTFGAEFVPPLPVTKKLAFINRQHIATHQCPECEWVRRAFGLPEPNPPA